jgi:superfamily II DNA/RNA helicase
MLIATTGRLIDHLNNTKGFTLDHVNMLILDEADKLLEMGFKDELIAIMKLCNNPKR